MQRISFDGQSVGYIVRGKIHHEFDPILGWTFPSYGWMSHADCIKSDGECVGFYGVPTELGYGPSRLGMRGAAWNTKDLKTQRPQYVNLKDAREQGYIGTALIIYCGRTMASAFDAAWTKFRRSTPYFGIVGHNCSTRANELFMSAGILPGTIDWMDTPESLYDLLYNTWRGSCLTYSGYLGFEAQGNGYDLLVEEAQATVEYERSLQEGIQAQKAYVERMTKYRGATRGPQLRQW